MTVDRGLVSFTTLPPKGSTNNPETNPVAGLITVNINLLYYFRSPAIISNQSRRRADGPAGHRPAIGHRSTKKPDGNPSGFLKHYGI